MPTISALLVLIVTRVINTLLVLIVTPVISTLLALIVMPVIRTLLKCNTALQHCCDIVSNDHNIVPTLQRCVVLKIVIASLEDVEFLRKTYPTVLPTTGRETHLLQEEFFGVSASK